MPDMVLLTGITIMLVLLLLDLMILQKEIRKRLRRRRRRQQKLRNEGQKSAAAESRQHPDRRQSRHWDNIAEKTKLSAGPSEEGRLEKEAREALAEGMREINVAEKPLLPRRNPDEADKRAPKIQVEKTTAEAKQTVPAKPRNPDAVKSENPAAQETPKAKPAEKIPTEKKPEAAQKEKADGKKAEKTSGKEVKKEEKTKQEEKPKPKDKVEQDNKAKQDDKTKKEDGVKQPQKPDPKKDKADGIPDPHAGEEPVIQVKNVTMRFKVATASTSGIKDYLIRRVKKQISHRELLALQNISFNAYRGEVIGIIGTNGSGKSTLLKIVSGALRPTSGEVIVDRSKIQLLTLGTGFDMELTARENVYLNGAIIGYSKEFLDAHFDEIIAFAELEGFVDEQVKNFSSGMVSRLGFAIATAGNAAEILILDEILSVGDEFFRKKSLARVKEMIHGGSTVLMVSHSLPSIRDNCSRVIWIEQGVQKMEGDPKTVCSAYQHYQPA